MNSDVLVQNFWQYGAPLISIGLFLIFGRLIYRSRKRIGSAKAFITLSCANYLCFGTFLASPVEVSLVPIAICMFLVLGPFTWWMLRGGLSVSTYRKRLHGLPDGRDLENEWDVRIFRELFKEGVDPKIEMIKFNLRHDFHEWYWKRCRPKVWRVVLKFDRAIQLPLKSARSRNFRI